VDPSKYKRYASWNLNDQVISLPVYPYSPSDPNEIQHDVHFLHDLPLHHTRPIQLRRLCTT
jgi:hypothetical protein